MNYTTATAFRQALDDRLKTEHATSGLALARLRKRVAFELFLRRLVAVAPGRWVLKGALALDFRFDAVARPTKDIDLGRDDDEQTAIADIAAAQQIQMDDFFAFEAELDADFAHPDESSALRFRVRAMLGGTVFEQFVLDIGLSDPIVWTPDTITTSNFLSFAGIDPILIPAIPIPQHIAEKVHAYTRAYGKEMQPSSRPKDLVDILIIANKEPVAAAELSTALVQTFTTRKMQELPSAFPPPPRSWSTSFSRMAGQVGVESGLAAAHESASTFLNPVLTGRATGEWSPITRAWPGEQIPSTPV